MSFFDLHSHRAQLLFTAVGAAFATATLLSVYEARSKRSKRQNLEDNIRDSLAASRTSELPSYLSNSNAKEDRCQDSHPSGDSIEYVYDEDLVREQLARNYAFFGEESMQRVRNASVVVVGCGGVGSWAAVMLARS